MNTKYRVVIIHGSFGSPEENWFPWLAAEIRKLGHDAIRPAFPTPDGQNLDAWRLSFAREVGELAPDVVLVGHSLGPGFILNLLEESKSPVRGVFLVSGFLGRLGLNEFDSVNESFVCREFDWTRIVQNAGEIHIYNSDNDPYVPLAKGQELADRLGVGLTVIHGAGHINSSAGFQSFPLVLHDLELLLAP